jgi:hypothetical protein
MRVTTVIAACIVLCVVFVQLAAAGEQAEAGPSASAQAQQTSGDELHFVSVLTFHGEIVAIDPAKQLVTLKGPEGELLTLEAEKEEALSARKVGERVVVRYFEGAEVRKSGKSQAAAPVHSLKDGMIGEPTRISEKRHAMAASVENIDTANQEITLKASDGSLDTIMVSNPDYLSKVKVGDRIVITHPQALALSIENES